MALGFTSTRGVCWRISVPTNSPDFGSRATWPDTHRRPMGFVPRSVRMTCFIRDLLGQSREYQKEQREESTSAALYADEARIGVIAGRFTSGNLRFGLFGGEPLVDEFHNLLFRQPRILQPADLLARQSREAPGAAVDYGLDGGIGKAHELQRDGLAAEHIDLIGLRHGQDLLVCITRTGELDGGVRAVEFMLMIVRHLEQRKAEIIGSARLLQFRELRDFLVVDIQFLELVERGGPHARLVEQAVIRLFMFLASGKKQKQHSTEEERLSHTLILTEGREGHVRLCLR